MPPKWPATLAGYEARESFPNRISTLQTVTLWTPIEVVLEERVYGAVCGFHADSLELTARFEEAFLCNRESKKNSDLWKRAA